MRVLGAAVAIQVLVLGVVVGAQGAGPVSPSLVEATFGKLPIYFVENRGVYPDEVAYYIQGADKTLFFTRDGITFRLTDKDRAWVVKLKFVGANPEVVPRGEDRQQAVFSYFRGPEKDWRTGLWSFSKLVYRDLWPGIALVYRADVGALKYEFQVAPGADPEKIRLRYGGASSVTACHTGALRVETPEGSFEDAPPVAWQEVDGKRVPVEIAYRLHAGVGEADDVEFGFAVGDYDATRPLVLDPTVLVYCGYIGGSGTEWGYAVAVDAAGNAYVAGYTQSAEQTFPVMTGPDLTFNGFDDAFVAKVAAGGTGLVYCGYIGGRGAWDCADAIAVDRAGNAYVTGYTTSSEHAFPVVVGPDLTFNGYSDAFVAKVNAGGTGLVYCGYIGGIRTDHAYGIAVDGAGSAYVAGYTESDERTFPVRVGPDLTFNSSATTGTDAFVAKVNAAGTTLLYCGYIGSRDDECARGIAVDAAGNAYVTGYTASTEQTFPVAVGPDLTHNGAIDAFVAKVNAAGRTLLYCGYIGGQDFDYGSGIAVDAAGNAYVTGYTNSTERTFPVVVGPDLSQGGGDDGFVAKVNAAGTTLLYCGYIGGSGTDCGAAIAVDAVGNAYVTGDTSSDEQTFPVVVGPDLTYNGGKRDAYVATVNAAGTGLVYCGYIGGSGTDYGYGVAVDATGNAYVTGYTDSDEQTFPVTVGPDLTHNGGDDVFAAKVASIASLAGGGSPNPGGRVDLSLSSPGDAGLAYQLGSSFGTGPIPVGNRMLGLSPDNLLLVTVNDYWPGIFSGYRGLIDSKGQARAAIHIPNMPALIGISIHTAFVTLEPHAPSGIRSISNTFSVPITK